MKNPIFEDSTDVSIFKINHNHFVDAIDWVDSNITNDPENHRDDTGRWLSKFLQEVEEDLGSLGMVILRS